jgi:5-methylcytosine-specific restriction endonuclease McrA
MKGFAQNKGDLIDNAEVNLFSCVSQSLFRGKHTMTYKYGFFEALLDNLFSCDAQYRIGMDRINETFAKIYWNLVHVHHVPQSPISKLVPASEMERLVQEFVAKNHLDEEIQFDSLAEHYQTEFEAKSKACLKKYVFGAFWGDTGGHIFGFSKADDVLWLNEKSFRFLSENKTLLEQVNYYEWLKMCETILKNANLRKDNLSALLENVTKRVDLSFFKDQLNGLAKTETCFYCGKHLVDGAPLDHVIPWDFIKQDQLWNLVFACPACNSSKNDRIPDQVYLNKLIKRNSDLGIDSPDILELASIAKLNGVVVGWRPKNKLA